MFEIGDLVSYSRNLSDSNVIGVVAEQRVDTYTQSIKVWWVSASFVGGWYRSDRFIKVDDNV